MTAEQLQKIRWYEPRYQNMQPDALREMLEAADALWLHAGDPKAPHAELTSGKHSNGFVDVLRALRFSAVCWLAAKSLATKIRDKYDGPIDWVIGSDHAGAVFSQNVALHLNAKHDFTEKGADKAQLWRRFTIGPQEVVVQVEELMTTALTLKEVRDGIRAGNDGPVTFAPVAGVLVHRSSVWKIEDTSVVPFAHYDITAWTPDECPLCQGGSPLVKEPKKNWALLTGKI